MANDNKLTIGLVVVVGLLAVVAIIISAVALSKNMPPTITVNNPKPSGGAQSGSQGQGQGPSQIQGQGQGQGQGGQQPVIVRVPGASGPMAGSVQDRNRPPMGPMGRIYSLAIGHDYGSHEYFDDAGYLSGFGIGLIDLVCEEAEIDCRIMWDRYSNGWDSSPGQHATGGQGLHDRWYDASVGWYTTIERTHVFQFAQPYLKEPATNFFTLPTKAFDTAKERIMNSKIVFIDGWASDEKCMARQTEAIMTTTNIKYVKTSKDAINLLKNGYDAIFTTINTLQADVDNGNLKVVGPTYSCMIAGNSIMSRKDNDITSHWNRGFMKLKNTGRFKKYCVMANAEHIAQGTLPCIDSF